jgi:hypothetical protein
LNRKRQPELPVTDLEGLIGNSQQAINNEKITKNVDSNINRQKSKKKLNKKWKFSQNLKRIV